MIPVIRKRNAHPMYMSNFLDNEFNSVFNSRRYSPAVNIKEDEKKYNIEMALPGHGKEDVKIEIEKDILMISSETKKEKSSTTENYNRREFGYESFCRNFTIPENAISEKISAKFNNGILNIEIPKSKEDVKVNRVIDIA